MSTPANDTASLLGGFGERIGELCQTSFHAFDKDVEVGDGVVFAGHAEAEPAAVGDDSDGDVNTGRDRDEGVDGNDLAAQHAEGERGSENVGDDRDEVSMFLADDGLVPG